MPREEAANTIYPSALAHKMRSIPSIGNIFVRWTNRRCWNGSEIDFGHMAADRLQVPDLRLSSLVESFRFEEGDIYLFASTAIGINGSAACREGA